MKTILVFMDGRSVEADASRWEMIDSGGEADIYEARVKGRRYIAKVFTEKQTRIAKPLERVTEMLRKLVRLRHRCGAGDRLPRSLTGRGLPVALGSLGDRAVMLFRYVEDFRTLADIANSFDELRAYLVEKGLPERITMARDVLRSLACLDIADIVHVDLTTANTAYGSVEGVSWVYLFDLETAALVGSVDYPLAVIPARDAHYLPVDSLVEAGVPLRSPDPGELPIALIPSKTDRALLSWILWTPVWYGFQLVSFVYLGSSPFQGLPSVTMSHWLEVVRREEERGYYETWPPRAMMEAGFLDNGEYRELSSTWAKLGEDVVKAMYRVFVVDVAERRRAPSVTPASMAARG